MACNSLYFASTDSLFEPYYKKGSVVLPFVCEPPRELYTLLTGNDPCCYSFRTNIYTYNSAFTFTSVSYKKDERINFSGGI